MTESGRAYWDSQAAGFDSEPDHGLLEQGVRAAWRALLLDHLPPAPADVVDLGCGTGSLSVLLAGAGYRVRGVDYSNQMVEAAIRKAADAGTELATFMQGDASEPRLDAGSYDVVLARHVLWALPDMESALARWVELLRPDGRLVLVEGSWSTGSGVTASQCEALVRRHRGSVEVERLDDPALWGRVVDDERYLVVSLS